MSPVLADIFMENLEEKVFMEHDQDPRVWKRFVDDILAVVKRNHGHKWLSKLNAAHENVTFTMEEKTEGTLQFIDVNFSRSENGELKRTVYQKPTHTNRYVQFQSHQPNNVKLG